MEFSEWNAYILQFFHARVCNSQHTVEIQTDYIFEWTRKNLKSLNISLIPLHVPANSVLFNLILHVFLTASTLLSRESYRMIPKEFCLFAFRMSPFFSDTKIPTDFRYGEFLFDKKETFKRIKYLISFESILHEFQ